MKSMCLTKLNCNTFRAYVCMSGAGEKKRAGANQMSAGEEQLDH